MSILDFLFEIDVEEIFLLERGWTKTVYGNWKKNDVWFPKHIAFIFENKSSKRYN